LKHLRALNKYFWKYRWRFLLGIVFIVLSNYFRILAPQLTGFVVDEVQLTLLKEKDPQEFDKKTSEINKKQERYDVLVKEVTESIEARESGLGDKILFSGITLLILALLGGFFMFLMRQTNIVMSMHIEYE